MCLNISVLVGIGFSLILCIPLTTSDLQLAGVLPKLFNTMGSCKDCSRSNQRSSTLIKISSLRLCTTIASFLFNGLLMQDCTHVRPLTKLRLRFGESLDSNSKTILISSSTLWRIFDLWRWWRHKVRILAANIKESWTFTVFWCKTSKSIPNVNKTSSISDDCSIVALIVGHTLVTKRFCIVGTILKICIHLNCCFVNNLLS